MKREKERKKKIHSTENGYNEGTLKKNKENNKKHFPQGCQRTKHDRKN